jgi:hypothetical protein
MPDATVGHVATALSTGPEHAHKVVYIGGLGAGAVVEDTDGAVRHVDEDLDLAAMFAVFGGEHGGLEGVVDQLIDGTEGRVLTAGLFDEVVVCRGGDLVRLEPRRLQPTYGRGRRRMAGAVSMKGGDIYNTVHI